MFNRKLNIVVTGANGQLGSYLTRYFREKSFFKNSNIGQVFGIDVNELDIRNKTDVDNFFNSYSSNPPIKIDYVIHCAAATNTSDIENDPIKYYAANCIGTKNIAEACVDNGIKLIFISTDYVLSEYSLVSGDVIQEFPINQYGLQKLIAEHFVKEAYKDKQKDYMILRSSWMFGNSSNSFVEKFLTNVFRTYANDDGKSPKVKVNVVDDAYGRPTPVSFITTMVDNVMSEKRHGTCNAQHFAPQISRYDWATMIWDAFTRPEVDCDDKRYDIVKKLETAIELVPIKSTDLNLNMRHPGKVYDNGIQLNDNNVFIKDTREYVSKNWLKYVDLANEIILKKA